MGNQSGNNSWGSAAQSLFLHWQTIKVEEFFERSGLCASKQTTQHKTNQANQSKTSRTRGLRGPFGQPVELLVPH